jgi:hypothetical protein
MFREISFKKAIWYSFLADGDAVCALVAGEGKSTFAPRASGRAFRIITVVSRK